VPNGGNQPFFVRRTRGERLKWSKTAESRAFRHGGCAGAGVFSAIPGVPALDLDQGTGRWDMMLFDRSPHRFHR
jgi:hypothetical protein